MAVSESMFLFEIVLENYKSFVETNKLTIRTEFADVFLFDLKDFKQPNIEMPQPPPPPSVPPGKEKVMANPAKGKPPPRSGPSAQSVFFASSPEFLLATMKNNPLKLSVWNKEDMHLIGSTDIPWDHRYLDFLGRTCKCKKPQPLTVKGDYNIFDEDTARLMVNVTFQTTVYYLEDSRMLTPHLESISTYSTKDVDRSINRNRPDGGLTNLTRNGKTAEGLSTGYSFTAYQKEPEKSFAIDDCCNCQSSKKCDLDKIVSCSSKLCINNNIANNTYCVAYCTIVNNFSISNDQISEDAENGPNGEDLDGSRQDVCKTDCPVLTEKYCSKVACDVPSMNETLCKPNYDSQTCGSLNNKPYISENHSNIEINLGDIKNACSVKSCDVVKKVKDFLIEGASIPRIEETEDEFCFCNCECKFGFGQKTTYCTICGGYEVEGTDLKEMPPFSSQLPACPIYHKMYDQNKFKLNSGNDLINEQQPKQIEEVALKASKTAKLNESSSKANGGSTGIHRSNKPEKIIRKYSDVGEKKLTDTKLPIIKEPNIDLKSESKKEGKKEKKTVTKFTFNYGFTGIAAKIGHSRCHLPYNACGAKSGRTTVPKHMGWLWNAKDVPGMKFRPDWRPGACSKRVVNLLRSNENPDTARKKKSKKEIALTKSKAKLQKKPLLKIHKKDGEYSVTMENMKIYQKQRLINQYPYEEKPPETFLVGREDKENEKRQKSQQREQRRKGRAERQFLQQTFRNVCDEICMTTYRQAIGILKTDESPECPCFPEMPDVINMDLGHSCSCSDSTSSSGSETDNDEWLMEFTPPVARYDPKYKSPSGPKHHTASQYSYLDYKVKLAGKDGKPVPRFFIGPDGKEQCSDLGGFYSPTGDWLQIGVDGYVSPVDGRWVPNTFVGPDGQIIDSSAGKFQGPGGEWLVIGVDGYIDASGKWVYDPSRPPHYPRSLLRTPSEITWSCFGDNVPPMMLAHRNIVGHSRDRKLLLERLKKIQQAGTAVTFPQASMVPKSPYRPKKPQKKQNWEDRYKCRHPRPSDKGISIDTEGKTSYFTAVSKKYDKSGERMRILKKQGIDMCDYHITCFDSLIGCREFKKLTESLRTNYSQTQ